MSKPTNTDPSQATQYWRLLCNYRKLDARSRRSIDQLVEALVNDLPIEPG